MVAGRLAALIGWIRLVHCFETDTPDRRLFCGVGSNCGYLSSVDDRGEWPGAVVLGVILYAWLVPH
jgi:hypothetical protein